MATFTAGQTLTAAQLNAIFDPLSNAWTAYTPTITNVTLGTGGSCGGTYVQVGKTVIASIVLSLGTGGVLTGSPTISLPVSCASAFQPAGAAMYFDSSASTHYVGFAQVNSPASQLIFAVHASGLVGAASPMTWAASDQLMTVVTYQSV